MTAFKLQNPYLVFVSKKSQYFAITFSNLVTCYLSGCFEIRKRRAGATDLPAATEVYLSHNTAK